MDKRTNRFIDIVSGSRNEAVVLLDSVNMFYVTGIRKFNGCILGYNGQIHVFTDITWYPMLKQRSRSGFIHCAERSPWIDALLWLGQKHVQVLKVDPYKTPLSFRQIAVRMIPGIPLVDFSRELCEMRMLKTAAEIAALKAASEASALALEYFVSSVLFDGITEKEAARSLNRKMIGLTGELPFFDTIIAFGQNTACPHWTCSSGKLSPGDTILVDCGACVDGYGADMTRIYFWKSASARQRRRYTIVRSVLQSLVDIIQPGIRAIDLDKRAAELFVEYGLEEKCIHPPGHGVGLEIHELPYFCMDSDDEIMINMVFALEPGIYYPGWGGIRLEETIWMSVSGPVVLSGRTIDEMPVLQGGSGYV